MKKYSTSILVLILLMFGSVYAAETPTLSVETPEKNATVQAKQIDIKGKVGNVEMLTINGVKVPIHKSGRFLHKVSLKPGANIFRFLARNKDKSVQYKLTVNRGEVKSATTAPMKIPEKSMISYKFLSPVDPGYSRTSKDKALIKIDVEGVLKAFINGKAVAIKDNRIFEVVTLKQPDKNEFLVTFKNKDNTIEKIVKIYKAGKKTAVIAAKPAVKATRIAGKSPAPPEASIPVKGPATTTVQDEEKSIERLINKQVSGKIIPQIKEEIISEIDRKIAKAAPGSQISQSELISQLIPKIRREVAKEIERKSQNLSSASSGGVVHREKQPYNRLSRKDLPPITLKLRDAEIKDVIDILSRKSGLNVVADESLVGQVTIDLRDVDFTTALNMILKTHGYSYTILENTLIIGDASKISLPTVLEPRVFPLANVEAKNMKTIVESFISLPEKVEMSGDGDAIIAYASPENLERIADVIQKFDSAQKKQVFIEAKIIEIGAGDTTKLGIDWGGQASISETTHGPGTTEYSEALKLNVPAMNLNYLDEISDSKVLASPKMTAIDGETALIHVGDKYPYQETEIDSQTGEKEVSIKFVEVGIKLEITPYINDTNETIVLKVKPEVSNIFAFTGENSQIPWVKTRQAETTVKMKNGETIIIGGLLNTEDKVTRMGVPLLCDIPIIGGFFSYTTNEKVETELLIIITPKII